MGTARVKHEEKVDKNNNERVQNMEEKSVATIRRKSPKQNLTDAKDLTIMLRESRLNLP